MLPFSPELVGLSQSAMNYVGLKSLKTQQFKIVNMPVYGPALPENNFRRQIIGYTPYDVKIDPVPLTNYHLLNPNYPPMCEVIEYDENGNETLLIDIQGLESSLVQQLRKTNPNVIGYKKKTWVSRADFDTEIGSIYVHFVKDGNQLLNNSFVNFLPYTEQGFKSLPYMGRILSPTWKLSLFNEGAIGASPLKGTQNYNAEDWYFDFDRSTPDIIPLQTGTPGIFEDTANGDVLTVRYDPTKGAVLRIQLYDYMGYDGFNPRDQVDTKGFMKETFIDLHTGARLM